MSNSSTAEATVDQPIETGATQPHIVPPHGPDPSQGKSFASWAAVYVIIIGALGGTIGLITGYHWISWVGLGVAVFGTVLGKVLEAMGFGRPSELGTK